MSDSAIPMDCRTPGSPVLRSLPEFAELNLWYYPTISSSATPILLLSSVFCRTLGSPVLHSLPEFAELNLWYYPTISSSATPILLLSSVFPRIRVFSSVSDGQSIGVQLQHQSFQWIFRVDFLWDWLVWSSCNSGNSQESSPAPQFKGINSLALSDLYGPTPTPIHDYWKKPQLRRHRSLLAKITSLKILCSRTVTFRGLRLQYKGLQSWGRISAHNSHQ